MGLHRSARYCLPILLSGTYLLLTACSRPTTGPGVSAAGRQLCRERMAQAEPGTPLDERRATYRTCLKGIEQERAARAREQALQTQQRQQQQSADNVAEKANWATPSQQLVHCRLYQREIVDAERQRIQALPPVMRLTREHGVNSPQAREANENYQSKVTELERLIPEAMRRGLPLLPEAVDRFVRCDAKELNNP